MSDQEILDRAERAARSVTLPDDRFEDLLRRRDRKRRDQRIAAGVVGIAVFVAAVWMVTTGGPLDRTQTPGGGGTTTGPTVTERTIAPEAAGIVGLPIPGTTPSAPEHGRLVLSLEGGIAGPWVAVWVYEDGRVIWGDVGGYVPSGAPTEGATGFVEQHLTPAGVEFLQTQVLSTGLFEHDLDLLLDPLGGFLTIEARSGDRLVRATWAWDGIVGKDAPAATSEQSIELEGIHALFAHPESWPASAWEDEDPTTYVPSGYQVWLRVFSDHGGEPSLRVGEHAMGLLPPQAADILRSGLQVRPATYEMTTDDIRALADVFGEAGLEPRPIPGEEAVLRYMVRDPDEPGYSLWVFVGPVLPHGEAFFLGPG